MVIGYWRKEIAIMKSSVDCLSAGSILRDVTDGVGLVANERTLACACLADRLLLQVMHKRMQLFTMDAALAPDQGTPTSSVQQAIPYMSQYRTSTDTVYQPIPTSTNTKHPPYRGSSKAIHQPVCGHTHVMFRYITLRRVPWSTCLGTKHLSELQA